MSNLNLLIRKALYYAALVCHATLRGLADRYLSDSVHLCNITLLVISNLTLNQTRKRSIHCMRPLCRLRRPPQVLTAEILQLLKRDCG
jgi:hypothetical protein